MSKMRRSVTALVVVVLFLFGHVCAEDVQQVAGVEGQPLAANVTRALEALEFLGSPLPAQRVEQLQATGGTGVSPVPCVSFVRGDAPLRKWGAGADGFHYLRVRSVKTYTAVVERCSETGLYVGFVPGFPGAHSQGETLDELHQNLREVIAMLLEDGEPQLEAEFVGTQTVHVG